MSDGYIRGMGFVPLIPVTLDNMTTNVPASDLPLWAANVQYALNEEVMTPNRVIWRSMAANNLGNDPALNDGKWQRRGVENRLRMFDGSLKSYTEHDDLIEAVITPQRVVTDVRFMGVVAEAVQVLMDHPVHGNVYDSGLVSMRKPSGNSHWGYFHTPLERRSKLHLWDLPAYTGASITVRILFAGAKARCGEVLIGRATWLGNTQWRPAIGFDDWSSKKRDEWGGWQVSKGDFSDRLRLQVLVEDGEMGRTKALVVPYRAMPVLWVGARGYEGLSALGYITSFEEVPFAPRNGDCSMTIEGLEEE